jgi:hypothetical protein
VVLPSTITTNEKAITTTYIENAQQLMHNLNEPNDDRFDWNMLFRNDERFDTVLTVCIKQLQWRLNQE